MYRIRKLWSLFEPKFQGRWEEQEYLEIKTSLKINFFPVLLLVLTGILIPYTIQSFVKDLTPQKYIIIVLFPIAFGFLVFRKELGKCTELLLTAYMMAIIAILTTAYHDLLPRLNQNESFYTGYSFAMVIRLLGYNVVSLKYAILIYLVQIPLKFALVPTPDALQIIIVLALDLATIGLGCKNEVVERDTFGMLNKMKKEVLKFKHLLTQYIPNQIAIFANDYSTAYYVNNAFKRTFRASDMNLVKEALERLLIEPETIESNKRLFGLKHLDEKNLRTDLRTFMNALSLNTDLFSDLGIVSFPVIEDGSALSDSGLIYEDQGKRAFQLKIFPLLWDDLEAIGIVMEDITSQKKIMELKLGDSNREKAVSMISHELRTPINGMLGLLDLARKNIKKPETLSLLQACRNNGLLMLNLVNSILDMSQTRNKKLRLVYSKFPLPECLYEIKDLFSSPCKMKNLDLEIEIDGNVPKIITTDKARLAQILVNLLSNALKFTFKGGLTLRVSLECAQPTQVKFCVKDTGVGIREEDQERLLKMLSKSSKQVWKAQTQSIGPQGIGLGLIISNTLAELLNSTKNKGICIESKVDVGTSVSFVIESENAENSELEEEEDGMPENINEESKATNIPHKMKTYTHPNQRESLNQERVSAIDEENEHSTEKPWCLVVEDNPFNLMIVCHFMEERGYRVKTALNGKEAVNQFKDHESQRSTFKLTLMDCQMPVMDGFEAAKILKELMKNGELHESPIFAITANAWTEQHDKMCQSVGMSGHITKPLQEKDLDCLLKGIQ